MNRPAKSDDRDAIAAISTLLDSHEARVLGAVGLFVGYLCVLLTKIMNFTQPIVGVLGVVGLTIVLLLLGKQVEPRSPGWWIRSLIVVIPRNFSWPPSVFPVRKLFHAGDARKVALLLHSDLKRGNIAAVFAQKLAGNRKFKPA